MTKKEKMTTLAPDFAGNAGEVFGRALPVGGRERDQRKIQNQSKIRLPCAALRARPIQGENGSSDGTTREY